MKKYQITYTVNQGEMKGKKLNVIIEGTDLEDAKARFDRTTEILKTQHSFGDKYKADIILVSEVTSKSKLRRLAAQGVPGGEVA